MAIHPNTQVGSKLFLCSTGRGICHLQAKLSKLQRQRGTTIHKPKPQAMCNWTEPQWRLSHLQTRKYTPFHSSPHKQPLTKTGFPAFTLKIAMNLYKHRGSSLKKSTFYWETQMGGCFKTKQIALLLMQHLLLEQNCIAFQLRHNMRDSSSPGLWESQSSQSFHATCPLWMAMLAGVSSFRLKNMLSEKKWQQP